MNPREIFEGIATTQNALKDGVETHCGWLLSRALDILKKDHGVHVVDSHFLLDGVEAQIWYPADKKTYIINIKEKSE